MSIIPKKRYREIQVRHLGVREVFVDGIFQYSARDDRLLSMLNEKTAEAITFSHASTWLGTAEQSSIRVINSVPSSWTNGTSDSPIVPIDLIPGSTVSNVVTIDMDRALASS